MGESGAYGMVPRDLMCECRVSIPVKSFACSEVALFIYKIRHHTPNLHIQANDFFLSPAQLEVCIESESSGG